MYRTVRTILFIFCLSCASDLKMETQTIIILLFALRVSAQLANIPPAPTLPKLDLSALPEHLQRLLANRMHIDNISSDVSNPRKPLPRTYGMKLRGDNSEVWNDFTGRHMFINNFKPSKALGPNLLHNKEVETDNFATANNNKLANRELNDYNQKLLLVTSAPSNTQFTTPRVKPDLPKNTASAIKPDFITNLLQQSISSLTPLIGGNTASQTSPKVTDVQKPSMPTTKPDNPGETSIVNQQENTPNMPTENKPNPENPSENIETTNESEKNTQSNDINKSENIPSIPNSNPDVPGETSIVNQQENSPNNPTENKPNPENLSENIETTNESDNINQSNDINKSENTPSIPTSEPDVPGETSSVNQQENCPNKPAENNPKETEKINESFDIITSPTFDHLDSPNQSIKTYGMKLKSEQGYIWNDLREPKIRYNIGKVETSDTVDDKPSTHVTTELDDVLKKYIDHIVKEEVARQLDNTNAATKTNKNNIVNNGASREESKKDEVNPTNDYTAKTTKVAAVNNENPNGYNNYGTITGNGKITNIFVFGYSNDNNIETSVSGPAILNKPVNEILNDFVHKHKQDSNVSNTLIKNPTESNQQENTSKDGTNMEIGTQNTTQSTVNITSGGIIDIDKGNQATPTSASEPNKTNLDTNNMANTDSTSASANESNPTVANNTGNPSTNTSAQDFGNNELTPTTPMNELNETVNAINGAETSTSTISEDFNSKSDVNALSEGAVGNNPTEDPSSAPAIDTTVTDNISATSDIDLPNSNA